MAFNASNFLAILLAEGPALFADIEAEINAIATGEGGAAKVANAMQGAAVIMGAVGKAAAAVAATPASAAPAPAPAPSA